MKKFSLCFLSVVMGFVACGQCFALTSSEYMAYQDKHKAIAKETFEESVLKIDSSCGNNLMTMDSVCLLSAFADCFSYRAEGLSALSLDDEQLKLLNNSYVESFAEAGRFTAYIVQALTAHNLRELDHLLKMEGDTANEAKQEIRAFFTAQRTHYKKIVLHLDFDDGTGSVEEEVKVPTPMHIIENTWK